MKFLCSICTKIVKDEDSVCCDLCDYWVHKKTCSRLSEKEYEELSKKNSRSWYCQKCISSNLPFSTNGIYKNPIQPHAPSGTNFSHELKTLFSNMNNIVNSGLQATDDDDSNSETLFKLVSCQYYDTDEFKDKFLKMESKLSAIHLNISSLSKHFDELNTLLALLKYNFSFIGLTETRNQDFNEPLDPKLKSRKFQIPGYRCLSTPTEASAGGAAIYFSESYAFKPRKDLDSIMYLSKQLESIFVEIILPNKTNIIVGTVYRHPCMSIASFNSDFLTPLIFKISSERKQLLLLGDFNVDLLKTDTDEHCMTFLNILVLLSFLFYKF